MQLEEAIFINSKVVGNNAYNEFVTAYHSVDVTLMEEDVMKIKTSVFTDEQVISEFTAGLRAWLGSDHVAVLSEM